MKDDGNVIYVKIAMARGLSVEIVGQTTTTLFKPDHTLNENRVEAAKLVEWLRTTADIWEEDFDNEFSGDES